MPFRYKSKKEHHGQATPAQKQQGVLDVLGGKSQRLTAKQLEIPHSEHFKDMLMMQRRKTMMLLI